LDWGGGCCYYGCEFVFDGGDFVCDGGDFVPPCVRIIIISIGIDIGIGIGIGIDIGIVIIFLTFHHELKLLTSDITVNPIRLRIIDNVNLAGQIVRVGSCQIGGRRCDDTFGM